jgi:hypothetical protein
MVVFHKYHHHTLSFVRGLGCNTATKTGNHTITAPKLLSPCALCRSVKIVNGCICNQAFIATRRRGRRDGLG